MQDHFRSAGAIAEEVLVAHVTDAPCSAIPKVSNLARQANRKRQKSWRDYRLVLKAVKNLLSDAICIEGVVVDFECELWQAVNAKIQGCTFHWTQAVWRKVQGLELSTAFHEDDATHKFIKRLMALPFLPHEYIRHMFQQLNDLATTPVFGKALLTMLMTHGSIPRFGLQRIGVSSRKASEPTTTLKVGTTA